MSDGPCPVPHSEEIRGYPENKGREEEERVGLWKVERTLLLIKLYL